MFIFEWLIKLIILSLILIFGSIFGLLVGCFGDVTPLKKSSRRLPLLTFILGFWLGDNFFNNDE